MDCIVVKDLSKQMDQNNILNNINFTIPRGVIFGVLGENGSGKTTLIECLLGLQTIDRGEIEVNQKIQTFNKNIIKEMNVYYISSETDVFEYLTGKENVQFNCALYKHNVREEEIESALKKFDLLDHKSKLVKDYSKGMKQRLMFCMMDIVRPDIIFLDEPTTGLDYAAHVKLEKMIYDLKRLEKTIIVATHDIEFAHATLDEWILLENGHVTKKGMKSQLENLILYWKNQIKDSNI